jgi:flagellar L-ring protein precursor FlgH
MVGALTAVAFLATLAASLGAQTPATAVPAAARPATDATPAARNFNWLGDKRSFGVGDILKVNVDEYALASANKGTIAEASRQRKMSIDIAPPSVGASALGPIDGSVGSGDAGQTRQRGEATRGTRYVGELPVRVIAVTKEGLLQVRGSKMIDVDKNKQEMTLTGFIRPQDVNSQDMVLSTSIADVQLAYKSKGALGKPKSGILTKIVGIFWP